MIQPFPILSCGCRVGFFRFHGLCQARANKMFTAAELRLAAPAWAAARAAGA